MRRDLPEHYLSEAHQRIVLVVVLQVMAMMTKNPSQFSSCTTDIDEPRMVDPPVQAATTTLTSLVSDKYNEQMNDLKQTLDILNGGIGAMQTEQQHISDQSLQQSQSMKKTDQDLVSLKLSIEESNIDLERQKTILDILHQNVLCMKQEVEDKQYTSYDGTLVWKITNVAEKMGNEILGHPTEFFPNRILRISFSRSIPVYRAPSRLGIL